MRREGADVAHCSAGQNEVLGFGKEWSRRRGSNPHGTKYHWILSPARLPVPPLRASCISAQHSDCTANTLPCLPAHDSCFGLPVTLGPCRDVRTMGRPPADPENGSRHIGSPTCVHSKRTAALLCATQPSW